MSYLTLEMVQKLKSVGFSFHDVFKNCSNSEPVPFDKEHYCGQGMVYCFEGYDYVIGGKCEDSLMCFSEQDQKVAREGVWLPQEHDLIAWLQWKTDCDVSIDFVNAEGYFYGKATAKDGTVFTGSGPDLLCCLYKLTYKICRHLQKKV